MMYTFAQVMSQANFFLLQQDLLPIADAISSFATLKLSIFCSYAVYLQDFQHHHVSHQTSWQITMVALKYYLIVQYVDVNPLLTNVVPFLFSV